ncbi:MAG: hypothetical protein ACLFVU_00745 [Phycisphaerae bacterium]
MLETFLNIADVVLGWLLVLPGALAAVGLAVLSAVAMVLLRWISTDQEYLGRCTRDKKRLKRLARDARRRKDKDAARRFKATRNLVQVKLLKAEGRPLLLSIPIIAFLGTWGYYRLEYKPPRENENVTLELSLPPSSVGSLVTLVPQEDLEAERWISRVATGKGEPAHGIARWTVRGRRADADYRLEMRYREQTLEHPLRVGQPVYAEPVRQHDARFLLPQSALRMEPTRVLGFIPWFSPVTMVGAFFPAWLVTYVLVVVPLVYLLKAVFKVY